MSTIANVTIHESQFPESVRRDLLESLRTRRVNHKFHYDSVKQTQKWLALHQSYSPTRNDADCRAIYERGFEAAAERVKAKRVQVVGLGCGGGQKDTRLLKLLKRRGREIFYTPCDVSTAMVLVARETALAVLSETNCFPFVCDLSWNAEHRLGENQNASTTRRDGARRSVLADDLSEIIWEGRRAGDPNHLGTATRRPSRNESRLITFFGMIPNFEPREILPRLAAMVRPKDFLLFSANLAPGNNYVAGMKSILPQYDNELTRDWLMTFLLDLGIEKSDGVLRFAVEAGGFGLKRVVARFHFSRARQIIVDGERFKFRLGESIRLFFSYRYTPERVGKILESHKLEVCSQWIATSGEEGIFLCRKR